MDAVTIALFFVYSWGLGYSLTRFVKNSENYLERNLMRVGIGLGVFPFIGILLSLLNVPLDWRIFLIVSLIVPVIDVIKLRKVQVFKFKVVKSDIYIFIVLVLFFLSLFMYTSGAFSYPWLEDDDPWLHAVGIKYVAIEKTVTDSSVSVMYLNPYPPGYDLLFGILHQTSSSLYWTMKFFNALIVSLSVLFFYFFAHKFMDSRNKTLLATFIFASLPCYLSHFIWSHSYIMLLFFPAMYSIEMLKNDKKWGIVAAFMIAGMCLIQPTKPIKFAVMFGIYFIVKWISEKKFNLVLLGSIIGGYLLSLIWWANHWQGILIRGANKGVDAAVTPDFFLRLWSMIVSAFPPNSGSATRAYSFNEIVFARPENMINNPIGIGIVVSILILVSIIYLVVRYRNLISKDHSYLLITFLWLVFTFLGFNSLTFNLPIGLFGFRFWMIFAIPAAILAAEGAWFLASLAKKYDVPSIIIIVLVVVGVIFTSSYQKYAVNTAGWPPGLGWGSMEEIQGYVTMKNTLPIDTKVFAFTENLFVLGFDMYSCVWCKDEIEFSKTSFNATPQTLSSFLNSKGYQYIVIDGRTVRKYGLNETNNKIRELIDTNLFKLASQQDSLLLLKVV